VVAQVESAFLHRPTNARRSTYHELGDGEKRSVCERFRRESGHLDFPSIWAHGYCYSRGSCQGVITRNGIQKWLHGGAFLWESGASLRSREMQVGTVSNPFVVERRDGL